MTKDLVLLSELVITELRVVTPSHPLAPPCAGARKRRKPVPVAWLSFQFHRARSKSPCIRVHISKKSIHEILFRRIAHIVKLKLFTIVVRMMIQICVSRLSLPGPVTPLAPSQHRRSWAAISLPLPPAFSGDPSSLHHGQGIR